MRARERMSMWLNGRMGKYISVRLIDRIPMHVNLSLSSCMIVCQRTSTFVSKVVCLHRCIDVHAHFHKSVHPRISAIFVSTCPAPHGHARIPCTLGHLRIGASRRGSAFFPFGMRKRKNVFLLHCVMIHSASGSIQDAFSQ